MKTIYLEIKARVVVKVDDDISAEDLQPNLGLEMIDEAMGVVKDYGVLEIKEVPAPGKNSDV